MFINKYFKIYAIFRSYLYMQIIFNMYNYKFNFKKVLGVFDDLRKVKYEK